MVAYAGALFFGQLPASIEWIPHKLALDPDDQGILITESLVADLGLVMILIKSTVAVFLTSDHPIQNACRFVGSRSD
jgi:hypothetical protein